MLQSLLSWLQSILQTARETYGVNPVIFLVLYLGCGPFWYYSLFRTLRAAAARATNALMLWSTVFLIANVTPFVYVILFGRNIPWWIYVLIAALVGEGIFALVRKIRQPAAPQG